MARKVVRSVWFNKGSRRCILGRSSNFKNRTARWQQKAASEAQDHKPETRGFLEVRGFLQAKSLERPKPRFMVSPNPSQQLQLFLVRALSIMKPRP